MVKVFAKKKTEKFADAMVEPLLSSKNRTNPNFEKRNEKKVFL